MISSGRHRFRCNIIVRLTQVMTNLLNSNIRVILRYILISRRTVNNPTRTSIMSNMHIRHHLRNISSLVVRAHRSILRRLFTCKLLRHQRRRTRPSVTMFLRSYAVNRARPFRDHNYLSMTTPVLVHQHFRTSCTGTSQTSRSVTCLFLRVKRCSRVIFVGLAR